MTEMILKDGTLVDVSIPSYGEDVRVTSSTPVEVTQTQELLQGSWHELPQIEHPLVVAGSIAPLDYGGYGATQAYVRDAMQYPPEPVTITSDQYASSIEASVAADVIVSITPSAPIPTYGASDYSSPSPSSGIQPVVVEPDPTEKVVASSVSKTFLTGSEHGMEWGWEQIRDYVIAGIEQQTGSFPRNPLTEAGIFKGFKSRWGELAGPIAIYAIDVAEAWWQNAPISVNRFCKGSDPYFSEPISKRVESALALTG